MYLLPCSFHLATQIHGHSVWVLKSSLLNSPVTSLRLKTPKGQGLGVLQSLNRNPVLSDEDGGGAAPLWLSGPCRQGPRAKIQGPERPWHGNQALGWSVSDSPQAWSPGSRWPGKWGGFPREQSTAAAGRRPGHARAWLTACTLGCQHPSPDTHLYSHGWASIVSSSLLTLTGWGSGPGNWGP